MSINEKRGVGVVVGKNENLLRALGRFRSKVMEAGTLDLYREKQAFVKPSENRRKARAARKAQSRKYSSYTNRK